MYLDIGSLTDKSVFETCAIVRVNYFGSIMQTFAAEESFGVEPSRRCGDCMDFDSVR